MICAFNLIPLATGMTGWNGRKTLRFYQLLPISRLLSSFSVLKCKKLPCLWYVT